jgi:predicted nucleic acid-binding protein
VGRPTLLVDAGPLYAYVDAADRHHEACRELFESYRGPLIAPILAVGEVAFLIGRWLGPEAEVRFVGDMAGGAFHVEPVEPSDWARIAALVAHYRDFPLGTVDASVIAAAERLGITRIATLDRRHFSAVRPAHAEAFELMP